MVGRRNADIADTLQVRDIAVANIFLLSIYAMHIGTTRQIRLNRLCAAAMWLYVKLLWTLVKIGPSASRNENGHVDV